MRILGIETATSVCAAALAVDGTVVAEQTLDQKYVHAEKLLTFIDQVLTAGGTSLGELDAVAVSAGPGSFTGLRIGLSVAKGLVYAKEIPLVAVPTLEALAHRAQTVAREGPEELLLPILDARREDVYCQLFRRQGDRALPLGEVRDCTLDEIVSDVAGRSVLVTGDATPKLGTYLLSLPEGAQKPFRLLDPERARCSAGSVALLGADLVARHRVDDPVTLEPRYIKEFFLTTHQHHKGT